MKAPRPQRCPRRRIRASYLQYALHVGGAIDVRLPMVFCRFLLWPRVRSPPRHARVQMPKGLGESLLQLLAFCDVMTGRLGCGPSVQHRRDRFACKFRMDLKESIEPQEPCSLRPERYPLLRIRSICSRMVSPRTLPNGLGRRSAASA